MNHTMTMNKPAQTSEKKLEGKVAIITGAGSGIGRAAAKKLAEHGAKICLMDLKDERTEEAASEIVAVGGEAIAADVDISDPDRVALGVEAVLDTWGEDRYRLRQCGHQRPHRTDRRADAGGLGSDAEHESQGNLPRRQVCDPSHERERGQHHHHKLD